MPSPSPSPFYLKDSLVGLRALAVCLLAIGMVGGPLWPAQAQPVGAVDDQDYDAAFPAARSGMGCPSAGCDGYELTGTNGPDDLEGGDGDDVLRGKKGDDVLRGGNGDDELRGGKGADELHGGRGADTLVGGNGDDELHGGRGADRLLGGNGDDIYTGGPGKDRFVFFSGETGDKVITDFWDGVNLIVLKTKVESWPSVADILASEVVDPEGYFVYTLSFVYTLADGLTVETDTPLLEADFLVK